MKTITSILLLLYSCTISAQGSSCSTPYDLILDDVCRDYSISPVTGTSLHCIEPEFAVSGRVTVFSFTTNASASCVLINLTTSGLQPAEVMMYESCTGGGSLHTPDDFSSVCFIDGTGLWAPSETFTLAPNTKYFLRVWTPNAGTLKMCAKSYPPPNNFCAGATPLGPTAISDNNACHKPSTEVIPMNLCAFSLENTAFYSYTLEYTGASIITISDLICDNSSLNGSSGFQIGFFTGTCGSLVPLNCVYDDGSTNVVQANSNSLPAGTQITVAIDGMLGSNCTYSIKAINAIVLAATVKYFTGWVKDKSNSLKWITLNETTNAFFEIEKSLDGVNFSKIGKIKAKNISAGETPYEFEDNLPGRTNFYRLKIVGATGKFVYSNTVKMTREHGSNQPLILGNPATDKLVVQLSTETEGLMKFQVMDAVGRIIKMETKKLFTGENVCTIDIKSLPKGVYYLGLENSNKQTGYSFIKQ